MTVFLAYFRLRSKKQPTANKHRAVCAGKLLY